MKQTRTARAPSTEESSSLLMGLLAGASTGVFWTFPFSPLRSLKITHHSKSHSDDFSSSSLRATQASVDDVVVPEERRFSEGDKILIKANYATSKDNRLPNGVLTEIKEFNPDGSISLTNGKTLGKEFKHFTHGYAVTSQGSQGKTTEKVIVSAHSSSGLALSKNQFYVSCSRGRSEISIWTNDKKKLKEGVMRSSSRRLVLEELIHDRIVMKKLEKLIVAKDRTIEKSRDMIDRAFDKWRVLEKKARGVEKSKESPASHRFPDGPV